MNGKFHYMDQIILNIREELRSKMDEKTRESSQHFFKEKIKCYGVRVPLVNQIGKAYLKQLQNASKARIFNLCGILWQSGYIEESFIACNWSYSVHKNYEPEDMLIFENWIRNYVSNWASCDTLCNHTVGEIIIRYPELTEKLKDFARSDGRWMRRAAAVSLILPARNGKFLDTIFEIADILMFDADDMVQKGYGWMLKAASKMHQKEVFDYVVAHNTMPRTAFRYAIEKMPQELKEIAMKK